MDEWLASIQKLVPEKFGINHEYENILRRFLGAVSIQDNDSASLSLSRNRLKHEQAMIGFTTG